MKELRCVVAGEPSTAPKAEYRVVRNAHRAVSQELMRGRMARQTFHLFQDRFAAAGLPRRNFSSGHSVGCW